MKPSTKALADGILALLREHREHVGGEVDALRRHVEEGEKRAAQRLAELERLVAKGNVRYCGTWRDAPHLSGDVVTDRGTLWYCRESTSDRPGQTASWQLMVKHER